MATRGSSAARLCLYVIRIQMPHPSAMEQPATETLGQNAQISSDKPADVCFDICQYKGKGIEVRPSCAPDMCKSSDGQEACNKFALIALQVYWTIIKNEGTDAEEATHLVRFLSLGSWPVVKQSRMSHAQTKLFQMVEKAGTSNSRVVCLDHPQHTYVMDACKSVVQGKRDG